MQADLHQTDLPPGLKLTGPGDLGDQVNKVNAGNLPIAPAGEN
jgi:hypothetical protein